MDDMELVCCHCLKSRVLIFFVMQQMAQIAADKSDDEVCWICDFLFAFCLRLDYVSDERE